MNEIERILKNAGLLNEELPPMFPHQKKAVDTTNITDFALIIRGAGSGKTRIGIEIIKKNLDKSSYVAWVCPASLVQQTMSDFEKADIPTLRFTSQENTIEPGKVVFVSYDLLKRNIKEFTKKNWKLCISDEFHRTRNEGTVVNEATWQLRKKCNKFYALTATPFNNYNKDFFELLSIVVGVDVSRRLESSIRFKGKKNKFIFKIQSFFMKRLFGKEMENKVQAKLTLNKQTILTIINEYIDYVEPEEYNKSISRPTPNSKIEVVELTPEEVKIYKEILKSKHIKNKEMALRMFLLSRGSAKIRRAVSHIKSILNKEERRIIVFSNFVESGLGSLADNLKKTDINFEVYKGDTDRNTRKKIMADFEIGKIDVLLISPSGFEGLNLKGTTDCIVLDPHYNPAKTEQIISRGLRAGSDVKKVDIFHYCAISRKLKVPTVDEKIIARSTSKKEINTAMEDLIKAKKEERKKSDKN